MKLKPLTPRQANALQMTLDGHRRDYICEKLGITDEYSQYAGDMVMRLEGVE